MSPTRDQAEIMESLLTDDRAGRIDSVLDARLVSVTALLEDVYMPQNMGACIRTMEALGIQDVHIIEGPEPCVPNAKITQGCHKWVDIHHHAGPADAVGHLRSLGFATYVATPNAPCALDELDYSKPIALCFGNERDGISTELIELADGAFRIPMAGFTRSFNLSVSLGICLHTATSRRRAVLGREGDMDESTRAALKKRWVQLGVKDSERILDALSRSTTSP
jgi:tRNA (guanosine-2'-O-)-methyltransferase